MTKMSFFLSVSKVLLVSLLLVYFATDSIVLGQEYIQEEKEEKYLIETLSFPQEGGSIEGSGTYEEGEDVVLTAVPAEGYIFANWLEGDISLSSQENYSFKATQDCELIGIFIPKEKEGGDNNER